jgi:hypothetical protein
MNVSIAITQFLGILYAGVGLSVLIDRKNISAAIREIIRNPGTLWLWGFITLTIGAVFIVTNNIWTSGWPLFITIVGWSALIKGLYILIFPKSAVSMYETCNKDGVLIPCGIMAFILGLVFLYRGFIY